MGDSYLTLKVKLNLQTKDGFTSRKDNTTLASIMKDTGKLHARISEPSSTSSFVSSGQPSRSTNSYSSIGSSEYNSNNVQTKPSSQRSKSYRSVANPRLSRDSSSTLSIKGDEQMQRKRTSSSLSSIPVMNQLLKAKRKIVTPRLVQYHHK